MTYITTAQANIIGKALGLRLEFNQATAGLVTVSDSRGTQAIIAVGRVAGWIGYGFQGDITVTNASAENITASLLNHQI
jgi:hypothetical protein